MNRRQILTGASVALPLAMLASCGLTAPGATSLQMAQTYSDDLANAVSAAAQTYLAGPPHPTSPQTALVTQAVADLQAARQALDGATASSDARAIALQVISNVSMLTPIVSAALGPAAPYVPLAIAVIQAFVNSIPPPPNAPPVPPAALHRAAMHYKGRG